MTLKIHKTAHLVGMLSNPEKLTPTHDLTLLGELLMHVRTLAVEACECIKVL